MAEKVPYLKKNAVRVTWLDAVRDGPEPEVRHLWSLLVDYPVVKLARKVADTENAILLSLCCDNYDKFVVSGTSWSPEAKEAFGVNYGDTGDHRDFWGLAKESAMFVTYGINDFAWTDAQLDRLTKDPRVEIEEDPKKPKIHWIEVIDRILKEKPDAIGIRYTDHEFRKDERNVTRVEGFELACHEESVEGILYNERSAETHALRMHLLHLLTSIPVDKVEAAVPGAVMAVNKP